MSVCIDFDLLNNAIQEHSPINQLAALRRTILFSPDTPLEKCIQSIDEGLDIDSEDVSGNTALFFANKKNIDELIKRGANVNHKNKYNETALFYHADGDIVESLLNAGCDPSTRNFAGFTCFHYQKDVKAIKALVAAGLDINIRSPYGETPIGLQSEEDSIRAMIELGADLKARTYEGDSIFMNNGILKDIIISDFLKKCKMLRRLKLMRTLEFSKWYCGENGLGRKVDLNRIVESMSRL